MACRSSCRLEYFSGRPSKSHKWNGRNGGTTPQEKENYIDKLERLPKMDLARMDDVAGCRLIFKDLQSLDAFRVSFHKARFDHKCRGDIDKYDYIKRPKDTGYRGIHDVYEYDVKSDIGRALTGLYVEIQYRTLVQHAWSTAVELIGFVTESQPKFRKGDRRYEAAMALASEILARAFEDAKGPSPDLSNREVVERFLALDEEIGLLRTLRGLNAADKAVTEKRNAILIFSLSGDLEVRDYRDATDALRALFELEKQLPDRDIVLVRADTSEEMRLAFKNYFSDARDSLILWSEAVRRSLVFQECLVSFAEKKDKAVAIEAKQASVACAPRTSFAERTYPLRARSECDITTSLRRASDKI